MLRFLKMGQTTRSSSQGQQQWSHRKVLSQGIFMSDITALALTVQKQGKSFREEDRMTE